MAKCWESFFGGERGKSLELEGSLSFVEMKLVLLIIKVKRRIMTSCIQYKIQCK